jgi:hypothetical protein
MWQKATENGFGERVEKIQNLYQVSRFVNDV